MRPFSFGIAALAILGLAVATASAQFALTDQDRVLFYGDNAVYPPKIGLFVEQFVAIRYPQLKTRFIHAPPFGRATADVGLADFDRVVGDFKPTWVVLSFGGFETAGKPYKQELLDKFKQSMSQLVDRCASMGAKVILLTPSRPEIEQKELLKGIKYDEIISSYSAALRELAEKKNAILLDWNAAMKQHVESATAAGKSGKLTRDGVAPTDEALGIAVDLLLTTWKAEPLEVMIDVDWAKATATGKGCQAEWIVPRDGEVRLLKLSNLPATWPLVGRKNPFPAGSPVRRFERITLRVTNAPSNKVAVATESTSAWSISKAELEQGYDLTEGSPLFDWADNKIIYDRIEKKNDAHRSLMAFDRRQKKDQIPEPELAPAYDSHRQAWKLSIEGWNQVLDRTPRTLDLTLVLTPTS